FRFGGVFIDGGVPVSVDGGFTAVSESPEAFGVIGDSMFAMPKNHPFADLYLHQLTVNYLKSDRELISAAVGSFESAAGSESALLSLRAGSALLAGVAARLGYSGGVSGYPGVPGVVVEAGAGSLLVSPVRDAVADTVFDAAATFELTKKVVQTLVDGLRSRDGDLHLTLVDEAVGAHPRPEFVWTAALTFIASRPELASLVRTVTDGRLVAGRRQDVVLPDEALALFIVTKGTERLLFGEYQRQATLSAGSSFRAAAVSGGDGRYLTEVDYTVAITDTEARIQWLTKKLTKGNFTLVPPTAPDELAMQKIRVEIARLNIEIDNHRKQFVQAELDLGKLGPVLQQSAWAKMVAIEVTRKPGSDAELQREQIVSRDREFARAKEVAAERLEQAAESLSAAVRRRIGLRTKLYQLEGQKRRAAYASGEQQLAIPSTVKAQTVVSRQDASITGFADEFVQLCGRLAALRTEYSELTYQSTTPHKLGANRMVKHADSNLRQAASTEMVYLGDIREPERVLAGKRRHAYHAALLAQGRPPRQAESYATELYKKTMAGSSANRQALLGASIEVQRISLPLYESPLGQSAAPPKLVRIGSQRVTEVTIRVSVIPLLGTSEAGVQGAWGLFAEAAKLINQDYMLPDGSLFHLQVVDSAQSPEFTFTVGDMESWSVAQHLSGRSTKEDVARQLLSLLGVTVDAQSVFALDRKHCHQLAQLLPLKSKSVSPVMFSGVPERTGHRPELFYELSPSDSQGEATRQTGFDDLASELARQAKLLHARKRAMPEVLVVTADPMDRQEMERSLERAVRAKLGGLAVAQPVSFVAVDAGVEPDAGEALFFVEWDPEGTRVPALRGPVGEVEAGVPVSASVAPVVPGWISRERMQVLDDEQVWRYSEVTADHVNAAWTKLENPLRPWDWEQHRMHAHAVTVNQAVRLLATRVHGSADVNAFGRWQGLIAYDLRRMCANGRWVQEYTIRLHLSGCTSAQQVMLARRAQRGLDALFNHRYRLSSGDQLHVRVEIVGAGADPHATITVVAGAGRASQVTWPLKASQVTLAHEVGHFLGIGDQYRAIRNEVLSSAGRDRDPVLRKHQVIRPAEPGKAKTRESTPLRNAVHDDNGLYAENQHEPGVVVTPRDIWRVEYVSRGYAAVRDYVGSEEHSDVNSGSASDPALLSPSELDRLTESMLRVAAYLDNGSGIWLADPATDATTFQLQETVVLGLPTDAVFFSVIAHVGPSGMPEFLGQAITPQVMCAVLKRMHDDRTWADGRILRFVSCGLGASISGDYIPNVLRQVHIATDVAPAAYAPNTLVWGTRNLSGQGSSHDLVVASKLGYDSTGKPVVSNDGQWLYYEVDEESGEVSEPKENEGYLFVAQDGSVIGEVAPSGYYSMDVAAAEGEIVVPPLFSMPFGDVVDGAEGAGGRVVIQKTVEFGVRSAVLTPLMDDRVGEVVEVVAEGVQSGRELLVQVVGQAGNNPVSSSAVRRGRERVAVVESRVEELLAGSAVGGGVTVTSSVVDGSGRGVLDRRDASVFRKRRSVVLSVVELDSSDDGVSVAEVGVAGVSGEGVAEGPVVNFEEEYLADDGGSVVGYGSWGDLVVDLDGAVVGDGDLFGLLRPSGVPGFLVGHDFSGLSAGRSFAFFDRLDLASDVVVTSELLDPVLLPDDAGRVVVVERPDEVLGLWAPGAVEPLPKVTEMPAIVHAVWLGGPVRSSGVSEG
ncbi:hypothetical protein ABTX61_40470, partial [Amycolatopsis japonica]|uniref:hypothetical protein n=1 Tax=Amycolatopsis japonica TaxID=208439 RepID=UPI00332D76C7